MSETIFESVIILSTKYRSPHDPINVSEKHPGTCKYLGAQLYDELASILSQFIMFAKFLFFSIFLGLLAFHKCIFFRFPKIFCRTRGFFWLLKEESKFMLTQLGLLYWLDLSLGAYVDLFLHLRQSKGHQAITWADYFVYLKFILFLLEPECGGACKH